MTPRSFLSTFSRYCLGLIGLAVLFWCPFSYAQYNDLFEVEEILVQKLGQMGMGQYQQVHLKMLKRDFSTSREDLQFLEANLKRTKKERVQALMAIPKSSKRYSDVLWALAQISKKPENKVRFYGELRDILKKKAAGKKKLRRSEEQQLRQMGLLLLNAKIEAGESVEEALVEDLVQDKRGRIFWKAKVKLMQADKIKERGGKMVSVPQKEDPKKKKEKKGKNKKKNDSKKSAPAKMYDYQLLARKALKELTEGELPWVPDYWGAMGAVEEAHAHLLLDNPKEALNSLKRVWNPGTLKQIERKMQEGGANVSAQSPMAAANFYLAQIREKQGQRGKKEDRKKNLAMAINLYWKVRSDYDESPYARQSITRFEALRKKFEKDFGIEIDPPKESPKKIMDAAIAFYRDEDWKKAYAKFMQAALRDLRGSQTADALFFATACLYKEDRFYDAMAVADFMAEVQPKAQRTHDMLYKTAGLAWNAGNAVKKDNPSRAEFLQNGAMRLFMKLAELAPNHPGSAAAMYRLAEAKWREADLARRKKDEIKKQKKDQRVVDEAVRQMQQTYLAAVPFYEVLTRNYGTTRYGALAFNKLGWIYYIAEEPLKAAENFLEYCALAPDGDANKLKSKFIAADQLYRTNQVDEARKHFAEILAWIEKGVYKKKHAKVAGTHRSALAMIPWCSDKQATTYFDKAEALAEEAKELELTAERIKLEAQKAWKAKEEADNPPEDGKEDEDGAGEEEAPEADKAGTEPPDADEDGIEDAGKPEDGDDDDAEDEDAEDDDAEDEDADAADEDALELPGDFGLSYLTFIELQVNLVTDLEKETEFVGVEGNEIILKHGPDLITGLNGKGLEVSKINDETYMWKLTPIACYRNGKLLGIYDFKTEALLEAKPGQAPAEIKLDPQALPTPMQVALQAQRVRAQAKAKRAEANKLRNEGTKLQNVALKGLKEFLKEYPKDKIYAPGSLLKVGVIYLTRKEYDEAQKWLDKLWSQFPNSNAAQSAKFILFEVFIRTGEQEKAEKIAKELAAKTDELPFGNLAFIAFKLFGENDRGEVTCMEPKLAAIALSEILRRADTNSPDRAKAQRLRGKAMLRQAETSFLLKEYETAIKQANELLRIDPKTPYFFDLWTIKGRAYRKQKKYEESLRQFDKILTLIDKRKYVFDYYRAVVGSGYTLLEMPDKQSVQRALFRFQQVVEFADPKNEELDLVIQRAYVGLIKSYALLGKSTEAAGAQSKFRLRYPRSPFRSDIAQLPAAKFR